MKKMSNSDRPKNTHAVALGKKGGKKTGRKGFAAMPAAEAERIRALAVKARRNRKTTPTIGER